MTQKRGCLGFLFKKESSDESAAGLPYRLQKKFLSAAELTFYRVIQLAVGDVFAICPKVRMSDVFSVTNEAENYGYYNKIARKHIDFLLCDLATMQPVLGVELDDRSHDRPDRRERDFFFEDVFDAARLPLVRVFVKPSYNPNDLREYLLEAAGKGEEQSDGPAEKTPLQDNIVVGLQGTGFGPGLRDEEAGGEDGASPDVSSSRDGTTLSGADGRVPEQVSSPGYAPPVHPFVTEVAAQKSVEEAPPAGGTIAPEPLGLAPETPPGALEEAMEARPAPEAQETAAEMPPGAPAAAFQNGLADTGAAGGTHFPARETPPEQNAFASPLEKPDPLAAAVAGRRRMSIEEIARAVQETAVTEPGQPPLCPMCKVPMVVRTSKRGTEFYGCPNFPRCRQVRGLLE